MSKRKTILFLTGTRADFGKLKPLIMAVQASKKFNCQVFVTGMHMMQRYGNTVEEVRKAGVKNIHTFINQYNSEPTELVLSNTINGLSRFMHEDEPDMLVVHGDRVEALAGAIVGALRNVRVGHIEGGEISGTVDELIRHSVSKLAHVHFAANEQAASRLVQLGEPKENIYVIGSPDIDVMFSENLPSLADVQERYELPFSEYGILIFHPVTTEWKEIPDQAKNLVDAVLQSGRNYVVVAPNNDHGSEFIFHEFERLRDHPRIRMFPSLRFEFFLTLLKNAQFILGNSSAGIREAPVCGVPTVNVGTRQNGRYLSEGILNVGYEREEILAGIRKTEGLEQLPFSDFFGTGDSLPRFMNALEDDDFWETPIQKQFLDIDFKGSAL